MERDNPAFHSQQPHGGHRLIHATNSETISAILQTLQLKPAQLKKLNKLRKQAGNKAIMLEQVLKPVAN